MSATALAPSDLRVVCRTFSEGKRTIIIHKSKGRPWPSADSLNQLRGKLINYGICLEKAIKCVLDIIDGRHILLELVTDASKDEVEFCLEYALTETELRLVALPTNVGKDERRSPYINNPRMPRRHNPMAA